MADVYLRVSNSERLTAGVPSPACVMVCALCGEHTVYIDKPEDHIAIRCEWTQLADHKWIHIVCPATIDTRSDVAKQLDREWELAERIEDPAYRDVIIQIREAMESGELPRPGPSPEYLGEYNPWRDAPDDPGMCLCARFGYHHRPGGW